MGEEVETKPAKHCPACHAGYSADMRFCPQDGTQLKESSRPENGKLTNGASEKNSSSTATDFDQELKLDDVQAESAAVPDNATRTIEITGNAASLRPPGTFADPSLELLGQLVEGRYEVTENIGKGGMSVVFKARDRRLKKNVAIKVLMPHLSADPLSVQRFQQEATAASHLDHPNIVKVYNVGATESGLPFMAMDLLQGRALSSLIKEKGKLDCTEALNIFVQLTAALTHAHEKGIIHRDLKPSNVILAHQEDGTEIAKLVDFGIAKVLSKDGNTQAKLTQTGDVFGSPHYMSPEQCMGGELDERSDVYSMGCLMYEALTGSPPHTGDSTLQILHKHISERPARIKALAPDSNIPAELEAIIFKCLEPQRDERIQTMKQLKNELMELYLIRENSALNQLQAKLSLLWSKRLKLSTREKVLGGLGIVVSLMVLTAGWLTMSYLDLTSNSPWLNASVLDWVGLKPPANEADSKMALAYSQMELYMSRGEKLIADGSVQPGQLVSTFTKTSLALARDGRLEDALRGLTKALYFTKKYLSQYSSTYPNLLYWTGKVHYDLQQYSKAEKYLTAALESNEWAVSVVEKGDTEALIADCNYFMDRREKAEEHYQNALDRWESSGLISRRYPESVARYADLIVPYNTQKTYRYAYLLYLSAKKQWIKKADEEGQNIALCDLKISEILEKTGEKEKAFQFLKHANSELASAIGEDNPKRAFLIMKYADALWARGEYADALKQRFGCWLILYLAPPPRFTKAT
ncbi:MAG TPA: protein kinase [Candidatus Melainabacteria bacterium]|nr:protein kinase [Candidatus Melainabacteria bacterium]